jgi:hypothetical protein
MVMTVDEHDANASLQRAFEQYLRGETPSPLEMAQAPVLENWRVVILQVERQAEPSMLPALAGSVTGHPGLGDSKLIRTSQLVWLDRDRRWARTRNRVYRLGELGGGGDVEEKSDGMGT